MTAARVLGLELVDLVARVHAQPFQHANQRLTGEHGIVQLVPGVVQADDEAVADQLVVSDPFDVGDVLDADLSTCRRRGNDRKQQGNQANEPDHVRPRW
jgi:hypothetical protein